MKGDNGEEMPAIISDGGQCHQQNEAKAGHGGRLGMGCPFIESSQGRSFGDSDSGRAAEGTEGSIPFLEKAPAFLTKPEPGVFEE